MVDIAEVIGSLGGIIGTIAGVVVWLHKAKHQRDIAEFKAEHAKDMRRLENDYRRDEARGYRWDDRQADAIQETVASLAALVRACSEATDDPVSGDLLADGWTKLREFATTNNRTGLFFDEELHDRLGEADQHAWTVLNHLKNRQDTDSCGKFRGESFAKAHQALRDLSSLVRKELRTHFMQVLRGVGKEPLGVAEHSVAAGRELLDEPSTGMKVPE